MPNEVSLIDSIQSITGKAIAMRGEEFVYLVSKENVEANILVEAKELQKTKNNELKCNYLRELRNVELDGLSWLVERHKEEVELGIDTTLSSEEYQKILRYKQYLRDIPQDSNFPNIDIIKFDDFERKVNNG